MRIPVRMVFKGVVVQSKIEGKGEMIRLAVFMRGVPGGGDIIHHDGAPHRHTELQ